MKKLIVTITLTLMSFNAFAGDWVLPAIGGFIAGTILNRPSPQVIQTIPQVMGPGGYGAPPTSSIYYTPGLFQQTYNCLVPVRDPLTGYIRNEVMTCVR